MDSAVTDPIVDFPGVAASPVPGGVMPGIAIAFARRVARHAGAAGLRVLLLVAGGAVLDGAGLVLLVPIVEAVVTPDGMIARRIAAATGIEPERLLPWLLAGFVALSIARAALLFRRDTELARLHTGFVEAERIAILRRIAQAPWERVVTLRHAAVGAIVAVEVQRLGAAAQAMLQALVAAAMLVVQAALAFALAPMFALATTALAVAGGTIAWRARRGVQAIGAGTVEANQAIGGSASGFLGALKAVAAQNAQAGFVDEFAAAQHRLRAHQLAFQLRQARSRRGFAIGAAIAAAAVVAIGHATAVAPVILITLVLILARMVAPAMQAQQAAQSLSFNLASFEAIGAFERALGEGDPPPPVAAAPPAGAIELRSVRYRHPGGGGIDDATLTIAPGDFVGITGASGAGKTTLLDLAIGLLAPQAGTVAVGGVALDAATRAGWRDHIAYVPQHGFLFHDSVRHNLSWGAAGIDDAAIWRAIEVAGARALVERLPGRLSGIVGERGSRLSGGEQQRLAIARAVLRAPRLLALDEAANAIDAEGEAELLLRLRALDPRPTILMISHRPESLRHCDQVIEVRDGIARSLR